MTPDPLTATPLPHEWPTDTRDPLVCTHGCGAEVRYNCMTCRWEVLGTDEGYKALWFAAHRATRIGA